MSRSVEDVRSAAVLVAAGSGDRAGGGSDLIPKQFRHLRGRPLLTWSFDVLAAAGCSPIVVAAPRGRLDETRRALGERSATVVEGGDTRQGSVGRALREVDTELVVIHDAARPFPGETIVEAVLQSLSEADGAISAVPVDETIKAADGLRITSTVDRVGLWRAQTPQGFRTEVLRKAHDMAAQEGFVGTDDAVLLERIGVEVRVVLGSRDNLKITYPEDLELAEAIAARIER